MEIAFNLFYYLAFNVVYLRFAGSWDWLMGAISVKMVTHFCH